MRINICSPILLTPSIFDSKFYKPNLKKHKLIGSMASSISNFRRDIEDVLYLTNPLIVVNLNLQSELSILPTVEADGHANLLTLQLKPSIKVDKKIKKVDKDEDREVDRANLKLKVKKKTRSKLSFEEDYETVPELFEVETAESILPLPLARPAKPVAKLAPLFTVKQKVVPSSTLKKKSSISTGQKKAALATEVERPKEVILVKPVTVQELAALFQVSTIEVIKSLFLKGISVTVNQIIDLSSAQKVGKDFDITVLTESEKPNSELKRLEFDYDEDEHFKTRPPIVTIMGHVDHGKTTLLDKIRNTQIAKKEAGGITQKIGVYEVEVTYKDTPRTIVFLDTPGHAAFSGMRSRGVSITDLVILVVAADDGIKPQTIEAIEYAQSAKVPLLVAINKMDKADADITRIQQDLTKYNIVSEEWGGDTIIVPISAMQGTNIDLLLESILLVADLINLKTNPNIPAKGMILESNLDRSKGSVATVIVQRGTLRVGDVIISGNAMSKIRGMMNSNGQIFKEAPPSSPVLIWGLSKLPSIGDTFVAFKTEKEAKLALDSLSSNSGGSNFTSFQQFSDTDISSGAEPREKINLIIKTDTQGSAEAINSTLSKIKASKVQIRVLYACAGEITETDIEFASASNSKLLSFNTTLASGTKKAAKYASVLIKEFDVIYDLFDYVEQLIEELVGPDYEERFIGTALVKTVFPLAKSFVAGSSVIEGKITKSSIVHVMRDSELVYKGPIDSLKKVKEDVMEVTENFDCGIYLSGFDSWRSGDLIKAFEIVEKKKSAF